MDFIGSGTITSVTRNRSIAKNQLRKPANTPDSNQQQKKKKNREEKPRVGGQIDERC